MPNNLIIVESPAKARTINKFLGNDYIVVASMGHVRDLPQKELGFDPSNHFEPRYEITKDKKVVWQWDQWDLVGNGLACWQVLNDEQSALVRKQLAALEK